jgi:predicted amidophosphoribosyltransferase
VIAAESPAGFLDGALVPVPPSPLRRAWRGFDPAEEITLALGRECGLGLSQTLVRNPGPRQVGRPRGERIGDPPRVRARGPAPTRAILVDDVVTTGATLRSCVAALREAGSTRVLAIAFAAAPRGLGSRRGGA